MTVGLQDADEQHERQHGGGAVDAEGGEVAAAVGEGGGPEAMAAVTRVPRVVRPMRRAEFDDPLAALEGQLDAVRAERDRLLERVEHLLDERAYWVALIKHVMAERDQARSGAPGP